MGILEVLVLALALGIDAFAVGAVIGVRHSAPRQIFRISWHFGLFQALMSLSGALFGRLAKSWIDEWSQWIACFLLVGIGLKMIRESFQDEGGISKQDPTRGMTLIGLSIAVSIDAMAAGFSLGVAEGELILPAVIIGLTSLVLTWTAMVIASRVAHNTSKYGEIIAGMVLIGLGVKAVLPL